ncbi:cysteine-rich small domain-containing protein [Ferroglobus sp.]|uniref:cysteine-rich small domain-containing protein n=1 Tax=Ferroglobus sp. TaxID=2614230 RepID=UPI0025C47FC3|nr:cysteine-rich small domain-containing protein [Ferroglobus sp.]
MREEALKDLISAIFGMKKGECEYYPCHFEGQDCSLCFCPFYPCLYNAFGRLKDFKIWSCMECTWIHEKENVEKVVEYFSLIPVQKIAEMSWVELNKAFQKIVFGEEVWEEVNGVYSLLRMNEGLGSELIDVRIENYNIAEVRRINRVEDAKYVLTLYDPGFD